MSEAFDSWAILEQLGHRRTAGRVTEEERFGAKMGRIDIPRADGTFTTHYFSAASVYGLTPTTEELARAVAVQNQPEPVHRWEMPKLETAEPTRRRDSFTAHYDDHADDDHLDDDDHPDDEF